MMVKANSLWILMILLVALCLPHLVFAESDLESLKKEIAEQREKLAEQTSKLEEMEKRLDEAMETSRSPAGGTSAETGTTQATDTGAGKTTERSERPEPRDSVGDLNAAGIKAGEFPGSITIPGTGDVSLAIGGFIKTVAIFDSDAENMGADFLPATLGTRRPDQDGAFSLDATLTRLHLDGRAPLTHGRVRGYVEADLNSGNDGSLGVKMRQAYGAWETDFGTLLAGHTWSTLMDLKILPEGLTEPTVSGVIFMRQPVISWSQPLNPQFTRALI